MKRLLAIVVVALLGVLPVMAQADSVDCRWSETIADASFEAVSDVSFPTEMAVGDVANAELDRNNRVLASVLAIVLGDFGVHHFYTGDIQHGILHAVFFWTGIPAVIGIIEGIMWLADPVTFPDSLF